MNRSRLISIVAAIALIGFTACDPEGNGRTPLPADNNGGGGGGGEVNNTNAPNEDDTHGEDDDVQITDVGFLGGTWRIATADGEDAPLAYLDFVHDKGATTATGKFRMGLVMGPILDGEVGDLQSATWAGDVITVKWNPTVDEEQVYTVTSTTKTDDDTLAGTFTTVDGASTFPVSITRVIPPDDTVRNDDPDAPIFQIGRAHV